MELLSKDNVTVLMQIPVVFLFCVFMLKLINVGKDYLKERDNDMKDSLLKVGEALKVVGDRVDQNTLVIIGLHPDTGDGMKQRILEILGRK